MRIVLQLTAQHIAHAHRSSIDLDETRMCVSEKSEFAEQFSRFFSLTA